MKLGNVDNNCNNYFARETARDTRVCTYIATDDVARPLGAVSSGLFVHQALIVSLLANVLFGWGCGLVRSVAMTVYGVRNLTNKGMQIQFFSRKYVCLMFSHVINY